MTLNLKTMELDMKLVSVIVPIYKTELFLDKCISSIANQTYKNIEIILVNDDSPDNSKALCEEWAKLDERIIILNKKNGGLSSARNSGLDVAKGDYITFIDSDDYIEPEMVEKLLNAIISQGADMAACRYRDVDEHYNSIARDQMSNFRLEFFKNYTGEEYLRYIIEETAPPMAWAKLYSKNFIANKRFVLGSRSEDNLFLYQHVTANTSITFIPDVLYNYLMRNDSITSTFNEKTYSDRIVSSDYILKRTQDEFFSLRNCARLNNHLSLIRFVSHMPLSFIKEKNKTYLTVISRIKRDFKEILCSKLSYKFKLYLLLFFVSPKLANFIVRLLEKN